MSRPIAEIAFQGLTPEDIKDLRESMHNRTTLVVNEQASALEVAVAVDRDHKGVVIVVTDDGDISGLVVPKWVQKQMDRHYSAAGRGFHGTLRIFADESHRRRDEVWSHEWLVSLRPRSYLCHAGPHVIPGPKCSEHPNARTTRRQ